MEMEETKMAEETRNNHNEEELEEQETNEEESKGNNSDNSGDKGSDGESGGKSKENKGKTFTQDQVTKMMTREKNQGRNAVYKELGIDPKDTKMVKMFKAFVESQKSDEEKAAEQESENQAKINEAEQRALVAEAKAEAMMLGVKSQYVEDVVTLALSKMSKDSDLKTIIGEFKTKYPIWFGGSEEDDNKGKGKTGQKGTGSSVKNSDKEKNGEETKGLGARLAAQRKSSKKSNYWGNK